MRTATARAASDASKLAGCEQVMNECSAAPAHLPLSLPSATRARGCPPPNRTFEPPSRRRRTATAPTHTPLESTHTHHPPAAHSLLACSSLCAVAHAVAHAVAPPFLPPGASAWPSPLLTLTGASRTCNKGAATGQLGVPIPSPHHTTTNGARGGGGRGGGPAPAGAAIRDRVRSAQLGARGDFFSLRMADRLARLATSLAALFSRRRTGLRYFLGSTVRNTIEPDRPTEVSILSTACCVR